MIRSNENGAFIVPIEKRVVPMPSGVTALNLTISLREVPVPERRYVADLVNVEIHDDDVVRFFFAQSAIAGEKPRSLIIVSMSSDAVHNLLKTFASFTSPLHELLQRNSIRPSALHVFRGEPSQTVALVANLAVITFVGREAEIDFFHLAPNALNKASDRNEVAVDPIVRVDMTTARLAAIIDELGRLEPKLPPEVK